MLSEYDNASPIDGPSPELFEFLSVRTPHKNVAAMNGTKRFRK